MIDSTIVDHCHLSSCFKFTFLIFINPFARHETEVYNRHQTKTYIHYRVGYIPPHNRQNNSCYFAAMLSISTNAPFGNALTAIAERAGKSPSKYLA